VIEEPPEPIPVKKGFVMPDWWHPHSQPIFNERALLWFGRLPVCHLVKIVYFLF
jgi:hypothetical protein